MGNALRTERGYRLLLCAVFRSEHLSPLRSPLPAIEILRYAQNDMRLCISPGEHSSLLHMDLRVICITSSVTAFAVPPSPQGEGHPLVGTVVPDGPQSPQKYTNKRTAKDVGPYDCCSAHLRANTVRPYIFKNRKPLPKEWLFLLYYFSLLHI